MSHDIGQIDLSGVGKERTWRIVIDTPLEAAEKDYSISVYRELVVYDGNGKVVQVTRDPDFALKMAPNSKFKAQRNFKAIEAVKKTSDVLVKIRDTVDALLLEQKGSE